MLRAILKPFTQSVANPTRSRTVVRHHVIASVFVTLWAMGLCQPAFSGRIDCWTWVSIPATSPHIFYVSDRLQVCGITTAPDAAFMVEFETDWDRAASEFVTDNMREKAAPLVSDLDFNPAIPALDQSSRPKPASSVRLWGYISHDPVHDIIADLRHALIVSQVRTSYTRFS